MSRRTRPKDPFRSVRRRVVNAELRDRVEKRFAGMYQMLLAKHTKPTAGKGTPADHAGATISAARARELAADFAAANRVTRRRDFGERSDGHLAPGQATMKVPRKRRAR